MVKPKQTGTPRSRKGTRPSEARALNASSRDTIALVVDILRRCGYDSRAILAEVARACEAPTPRPTRSREVAPDEIPEAAHLLTVWHKEPDFLIDGQHPRPLSLSGNAPSLTTLVRRVAPGHEPRTMLGYLLRVGAVRRNGHRYVPTRPWLLLRGRRGPVEHHHLRGLHGMLRNTQHNLTPRAPPWLERLAENRRFPLRLRPAFVRFFDEEAMRFLTTVDEYLRLGEATRRPGEPVTHQSAWVFRVEEVNAPGRGRAGPRHRGRRGRPGSDR